MGNNPRDPNKPPSVMPPAGVTVDVSKGIAPWREALQAQCGPEREAFNAAKASITQAAERMGRTKMGKPAADAILADLARMELAFLTLWGYAYVFPAQQRLAFNKTISKGAGDAKKAKGPYAKLEKEWNTIMDAGGWRQSKWDDAGQWVNHVATRGLSGVNVGTLRVYAYEGGTWSKKRKLRISAL